MYGSGASLRATQGNVAIKSLSNQIILEVRTKTEELARSHEVRLTNIINVSNFCKMLKRKRP